MNIIQKILTFLNAPAAPGRPGYLRYFEDPLTHPDIQQMDQRMLGDLPMPKLPARNPVQATATFSPALKTDPCAPASPAHQCDQA